jgi:hypothetical protein
MKIDVFFEIENAKTVPDRQGLCEALGSEDFDLEVNSPEPNKIRGRVTFNEKHFPYILSACKKIQFFLAGKYDATSFINLHDHNLHSADVHMLVIEINNLRAGQMVAIAELLRLARQVKKTRVLFGNKKFRQIRVGIENLAKSLAAA